MGEIYRRTQKVLIWLGPGNEYSGNVIKTLKQLAAQSNRYGVQRAADGSPPKAKMRCLAVHSFTKTSSRHSSDQQ
jgi:hypothetical protein